MRVAVVGAGVMGASVAIALQRGGAEVTLVEAVGPGSGTSSRGAGLVCEGMWHPTSLAVVRRGVELLTKLSAACEAQGVPFRFHAIGSTTLVPPDLAEDARALARAQAKHGATVRELALDEATALPRHAGIDTSGAELALHYPNDGWALPRMYAEVCAAELEMRGGSVRRAAARLQREGRGVALWTDGERVEADAVVLAAGVQTRALLATAGLDAPLLAYRTQAARLVHARAAEVPILHDAVEGFYMRPGHGSHCLAGNGTTTTPEDPQRWNMQADGSFVRASVARVRRRFPHLAELACDDAWAGIDTATPDRLPLAGPHPEADGLWLFAGGNGMGFMRAPATGESLAAMLLGKRPRVDVAAFDPRRFAERWAQPFDVREGYTLEAPTFM